MSRFSSDDFTEGTFSFTIEKKQNLRNGSDVIRIDTVRQDIKIPVEWWTESSALIKDKEQKLLLKKKRAELMHNYLYFRTGSIGFEDFAEDSGQVLKELYRSTEENEWKLYRMHFLLMEEQQEEAKAAMEALEEIAQKGGFKPLEANYFLYLKAMYYRTPEVISKAVTGIRE